MHGLPHLVIGAATGLVVAAHAPLEQQVPLVALAATAALLPDLDTQHSMASKGLRGVAALAVLAGGLVGATRAAAYAYEQVPDSTLALGAAVVTALCVWWLGYVVCSRCMPSRLFEHRGPMHSLLAALLAGGFAWWLGGPAIGTAVGLGWLSHLVADCPTYYGLPLLWPFRGFGHDHWRMGAEHESSYTGVRCQMVHVTPPWLRFRSGNPLIEWPLAGAALFGAARASGFF